MKKLIKLFLGILIIIFACVLYMTYRDNSDINRLEKQILKNTKVLEIDYLNTYGNYYLVMDKSYLYVFDNKYHEILKIDKILIHENTNNYDIIYKEKPMYMKDYYHDNKVYFKYYDLYDYQELGGKDE